jgi:hypothetical protein
MLAPHFMSLALLKILQVVLLWLNLQYAQALLAKNWMRLSLQPNLNKYL